MSIERVDGATPHGGTYTELIYSKKDGTPCAKSFAERVEITEYDKADQVVFRIYGEMTPSKNKVYQAGRKK